jgi:hypothetical protein
MEQLPNSNPRSNTTASNSGSSICCPVYTQEKYSLPQKLDPHPFAQVFKVSSSVLHNLAFRKVSEMNGTI